MLGKVEGFVSCTCKTCGKDFEVARFTGEKKVRRTRCTPCGEVVRTVYREGVACLVFNGHD